MTADVFSVPIFFIIFRGISITASYKHLLTVSAETLEAAIIVSVLLSFVKNAVGEDELPLRKRLTKQVTSFVYLSQTC